MKIAVASDDATNVSERFDHAPYYLVFTVEEGKEVRRSIRPKGASRTALTSPGQSSSCVVATIADCEVLLAGGLSQAAADRARQVGIEPVLAQPGRAEEAVVSFLQANASYGFAPL